MSNKTNYKEVDDRFDNNFSAIEKNYFVVGKFNADGSFHLFKSFFIKNFIHQELDKALKEQKEKIIKSLPKRLECKINGISDDGFGGEQLLSEVKKIIQGI